MNDNEYIKLEKSEKFYKEGLNGMCREDIIRVFKISKELFKSMIYTIKDVPLRNLRVDLKEEKGNIIITLNGDLKKEFAHESLLSKEGGK